MKKKILIILFGILYNIFVSTNLYSQCSSNSGFESGNLSSWNSSTDSIYMTPASRVYSKPGINTNVIGYGVTDPILGVINRADNRVGNYLARIGNSSVNGTSDTIYRKYIIDSLSDGISIYSIGVSQGAHAYWGLSPIEAPGFGYQVFINGREMDCIGGKFFCGNTDPPPVWQFGRFKDSSGLRKSTNWGIETLNLSCFVGDTVEIRLFTRDCIFLGHFAYAYFDVVCSNAQPPSQLFVKDIIPDTSLLLFNCESGQKIKINPVVQSCPYFMDSIVWTPANYIKGSRTSDTARVDVVDSGWVYVEAQFTNYCITVKVKDSIFVRKVPFKPRLKIPEVNRIYCDCKNDTLNFRKVNMKTITNDLLVNDTLRNGLLVVNPCDNFYVRGGWKNLSSGASTSGGSIGAPSWTTGNNQGGIGFDTLIKEGKIRYVITIASGKNFFAGINNRNINNNNDLTHSVFFSGTSLNVYHGTNFIRGLGNYTGRVVLEFIIDATGRVRIYVNNTLVYTYSTNRLANGPTFPDYSGWSANNPHIDSTFVYGPTVNKKRFTNLQNTKPFKYYIQFDAGCGKTTIDTITYIPGFSINKINDVEQCGLSPVKLTLNSTYKIDSFKYQLLNSKSKSSKSGTNLSFNPSDSDYFKHPVKILVTSYHKGCKSVDTAKIWVNEIPIANAGPDTQMGKDTFRIGGYPTGYCASCDTLVYLWGKGTPLYDSTESNPLVNPSQLIDLKFIVKVLNPKTGCYDIDTMVLLAPLPVNEMELNIDCYSDNNVSISWQDIETDEILFYGVERSSDGGKTWIEVSKIRASKNSPNSVAQYQTIIEKTPNLENIYRWYSEDYNGEKSRINYLYDLDCDKGTTYIIFPNPFNNTIEIRVESKGRLESSYNVQIINQYGQIVDEKIVECNETKSEFIIHLNNIGVLSNGLYVINIMSKGRVLYKKLILKQ
jgi:hypothetical protein